jgi:predicted nuclease of restriction endonuclease-like (RecB) superfamily
MIKREEEYFFKPLKSKIKSIEDQWFFIFLTFINLILRFNAVITIIFYNFA